METKICNKCKKNKNICEFGKHKTNKDGLRNQCKDCRKIEGKIYREKNLEKRKQILKNWYIKNPHYNKNYYFNNSEKIGKQNKDWYECNKDTHKKNGKMWKEKNVTKVRKYHNNRNKELRKNDPLKKMTFNVRTRIGVFLKKNEITKNNTTFKIVGCSPEFLKEYLEKQFISGMSWDNYGKFGWHIDHIIPLSSANTEEEIYKLCHYSNLQPLWAQDNLIKGNRVVI
jgi:hypothetical protein